MTLGFLLTRYATHARLVAAPATAPARSDASEAALWLARRRCMWRRDASGGDSPPRGEVMLWWSEVHAQAHRGGALAVRVVLASPREAGPRSRKNPHHTQCSHLHLDAPAPSQHQCRVHTGSSALSASARRVHNLKNQVHALEV